MAVQSASIHRHADLMLDGSGPANQRLQHSDPIENWRRMNVGARAPLMREIRHRQEHAHIWNLQSYMIQRSIRGHRAAIWMTGWPGLAPVHKLQQGIDEGTVNRIKMRAHDV